MWKHVRDMIRTDSDTLLLEDVFESFRNKCIEIYELDPAYFLSAPGLAWQACLNKTKIEIKLLTDIDMLLIVEKRIRGGICHEIHRYATADNKYMKNYDKDKESSYLMYLGANNLHGWKVYQKLPVTEFRWQKNTSKFSEKSTKNYDKASDIGYILEVDVEYLKRLQNFHNDLPLLPERMRI